MIKIRKERNFLGTFAGTEEFLPSYNSQIFTYSRKYYPFGGSKDLRNMLSNCEAGKKYNKLGEEYSFTPLSLRDGRNFGSSYTDMQGGGFFLTLKTFKDQKQFTNCFGYALSTYGDKLEEIACKNMEELQESAKESIDKALKEYFDPIPGKPMDGDLAVYQTSKYLETPGGRRIKEGKNTHAGIYRKSKPNWNSPFGGTIESKWGWFLNPHVFQHDIFFTPEFYGDTVKFYRLKKS